MLSTSRDLLQIALALAILGVSGYLCYLLYSWAKLVQETKKTIEDVNKKLEKINPLVDSAAETADSLLGTMKAINDGLLKPITSLSEVIKKIREVLANLSFFKK